MNSKCINNKYSQCGWGEIRNICDYFSWNIVQLIRIKYGPYKLLDLKKGEIKEIKKLLI